MKNTFIAGLLLLLPLCTTAKDKIRFSGRETIDIQVATPGLFGKGNKIELRLDSLTDKEYAFPLPGAKVISNYGSKNHRRGHSGIDIKTCGKDTICCAFDGVVRLAKPYGGYGNVIVVRHPNGLETVYSHNFKNFVKSGDVVKVGQPIALTGRTGRASTEHLHFETRVNGVHFNPNLIFDMAKRTLRKDRILCTKTGRGVVVRKNKKETTAPVECKPVYSTECPFGRPSAIQLPRLFQTPVLHYCPGKLPASIFR